MVHQNSVGGDKEFFLSAASSYSSELPRSARCSRCASYVLAVVCVLSPVLMVALPASSAFGLKQNQLLCSADCDGALVALAFKLLALCVGWWALFGGGRRYSSLPRMRVYRAGLALLLSVVVAAFWLFYASHVIHEPELVSFSGLVGFASGLTDVLLFVHYLSVVLIELRHRSEQFYVRVVRSPDGESRGFAVGPMSVQMAAAWVLDR